MNKQRRQELCDVLDYLDEAIDRLEEIKDDEQEAFDNLSDGLQNSRTGDSMQMAIDQMTEIGNDIEVVKDKVEAMMLNKK